MPKHKDFLEELDDLDRLMGVDRRSVAASGGVSDRYEEAMRRVRRESGELLSESELPRRRKASPSTRRNSVPQRDHQRELSESSRRRRSRDLHEEVPAVVEAMLTEQRKLFESVMHEQRKLMRDIKDTLEVHAETLDETVHKLTTQLHLVSRRMESAAWAFSGSTGPRNQSPRAVVYEDSSDLQEDMQEYVDNAVRSSKPLGRDFSE